jgi:glycolate oxidase iron-sulfur subunit
LSLNENESPRGRISLIQALANKQLQANDALLTHLEHCLQCRRCERVCPSQVKYGEILSTSFQQIGALKSQASFTRKLGLFVLQTPHRLRLLRKALRFYQISGLQFIARRSGILKLLRLDVAEQRLPAIAKENKIPVVPQPHAKQVALFSGCAQTVFDNEAITSAVKLLNALDIDVVIPEQQGCCGALHNLQGEAQRASTLINHNTDIFKKTGIDTVLYLSTGCGAFIKEQYDASISFQEITEFLGHCEINKLVFNALEKTVAVQLPCSQKNVLQQADTASALLENIPGIELVSLAQHGCCGAGGTTMLKYPQMADEIRQPLLDKIIQSESELVATTNPGCQIHLQAGLANMKVIHPVTLLARQLQEKSSVNRNQ